MKKAFLVVSVCALLIACSDDDPQQAAQDMTAHGNYDLSKEHDEAKIINEKIADNDQYKIVLISNRYGSRPGSAAKGEHKTKFYMESKTDQDIYFKVDDVIIDSKKDASYEIRHNMVPGVR